MENRFTLDELERLHADCGIHTLGWLINQMNKILKDVSKSCYPEYAKQFKDTLIEEVKFSGDNFKEQASIYCEEAGWKRPR